MQTLIFRQNALRRFPLCDDRRTPASSSSFIQSEAVVYLENGFKPNRAYNHTGFEATMYFRPEVLEMTALGRILVARRFAPPHQLVSFLCLRLFSNRCDFK